MEVLFVKLPKGQRKLVSRELFKKCGESTNFSRSFTGVPFRNLAEIPRLTPNEIKIILGKDAVAAFDKDRVHKEVLERGHPLFWGEWKPVTLYSTLIHDFQVDNVVDLTPGSGAACLASLYSKVLYTGIAYNAKLIVAAAAWDVPHSLDGAVAHGDVLVPPVDHDVLLA